MLISQKFYNNNFDFRYFLLILTPSLRQTNINLYDESLLFSGYACLYFILFLVWIFRVFYFE